MDTKKQKLLIEYLISSPDTFALCQNIVKSNYFDPEFRNAISFIKQYYEKYDTTPGIKQIEAESGHKFLLYEIRPDEIKYCSAEIETFCKQAAMRKMSVEIIPLIKEEKYGDVEKLVKEAATVSLTKELGLRYFDTVEERIERMLNEDPTVSTGWSLVDKALYGGISRKELLLVSANSGGGKSLTLANLGFNFITGGLNVLYISLELSADIVAQRYDTMFTGISRRNWKEHTDEISTRITEFGKDAGILDIIQMSAGTSSNQIRAYLKEFNLHYGMMPDLLILDYIDKMSPDEKVSADNVFEKDKRNSEQLRQIGVDYNMFIATASQLGRSAVGSVDHNHSQIAGGISKINEADVYWSIIMNEEMRVMGKIIFVLQKTRNSDGVGSQIHLKWDSKHLRIVDDESDDSGPLTLKKKKPELSVVESDEKQGDKLTDLLTSLF